MPFTLGVLVERCKQRFAGEGEELLPPAELKAVISEYYGEIHALTTEKGAGYFRTDATVNLANLALPSDHLTTLGVDAFLSGSTGRRRPVYGPIMEQERARLTGRVGDAFFWGHEGANLALYPLPSSGTYKHIYVPQPTDFSDAADSTSVDVINIYGLRFILWGVASVALHKGSSSQQRAVDEAERAKAQIEYWACQRALHQPSYRVPDEMVGGSLGFFDPGDWRWAP